MNAEQMFKELGYEKRRSAFNDWIEYGIVEKYPMRSYFRFDTTFHQFECALEMMNWGEIKAVIQQMKELGWLDEIEDPNGFNYETIKALKDSEEGKNLPKTYESVDELIADELEGNK